MNAPVTPVHAAPETTFAARVTRQLLATDGADRAATIARVTLALVMLPHGLQKTLGWFGGYGFEGTYGFLTGQVGLPGLIAFLLILAESLGALALLGGLVSRVAAAGIGAVMLGATLMVHAPNGFFMNWTGQQAGEGFEFHLLALGLAAIVILRGGGALSIDGWLARRASRRAATAR